MQKFDVQCRELAGVGIPVSPLMSADSPSRCRIIRKCSDESDEATDADPLRPVAGRAQVELVVAEEVRLDS